jgi:Leucine-rich repeat (LRR) protein
LTLAGNDYKSLPAAIGFLKNLQKLDLSDNKFSTLPEEIYNLSELKELILADCDLTKLSQSLSQLQNLEVLDLRYNTTLKYLPESIKELKKLKVIYLHNVALSAAEKACIAEWLPQVKVYY